MADINAIKLPDGITYNITDKKLEINQADNNTFYYPILGADESAAIRQYDGGLRYMRDDDAGKSIFMIGQTQQMNDEVSSTGELVLTDYNEGMTTITTDGTSNNVTLYLPSENGTLALTSDIPSVPSWAMASTKPTYTASEVGALPSTTLIPTKTSDLTNDGDGTSAFATIDDISSLGSGTITQVKTTAGAHTTINVSNGAVSFNVPTTAEHVGIKFGYTTSGNNRAVQQDSSGNLYVTQKDDNTTYSSKAAASGGTDVSLVTTGEKYTWNSKTSNTGTVTSVAASGSGGITISGSPITTSGTITVGLDLSTAINGLSEGASPAQLNDYIVAQYAGGGTTTTTYHRRKLSNIIVGKAVSDQNGLRIDTGYLKLTGGNVTGSTTFGDTVSIDDLNAGQLVVSGSANFLNGATGLTRHYGNLNSLGSGTPAAATKDYFINSVATNQTGTAYNSSGSEFTLLFGRGGNYGTVLKFGYDDLYLYKLRYKNSSWLSNDWEKISAGHADSADTATNLASIFTIGSGTSSHATAIKNWFDASKASIKRNVAIANYSSASGNGSIYIGYFLSGYDTNPYGGFFVAHYNNPYYVGISNGTYTQQAILTSTNYTSFFTNAANTSF